MHLTRSPQEPDFFVLCSSRLAIPVGDLARVTASGDDGHPAPPEVVVVQHHAMRVVALTVLHAGPREVVQ